jgi:hypothetical protein
MASSSPSTAVSSGGNEFSFLQGDPEYEYRSMLEIGPLEPLETGPLGRGRPSENEFTFSGDPDYHFMLDTGTKRPAAAKRPRCRCTPPANPTAASVRRSALSTACANLGGTSPRCMRIEDLWQYAHGGARPADGGGSGQSGRG